MAVEGPREGVFAGGLPFLKVGSGQPLVYLCGSTSNHRNPAPGLERTMTLRTVRPLANAGFEVYFTNRWPGMPVSTTFAEVAARHAEAIAAYFGEPVDVVGHSTGGSLLLQLIADRPDVVRKAVVACAAYTLGPVGRSAQRIMLHDLEESGHYSAAGFIEGLPGMVHSRVLRALFRPIAHLTAKRIRIDNVTDAIAMLRAEDGFNVRDRLEQIPIETLLICGARDGFWTLDMFAETSYQMPRGRMIMYPNRGHALVAAPEFARDVASFLHTPAPGSWREQ